jgi:hypothetical protein
LSIEIKTTHSHNKHVKVNQTYEWENLHEMIYSLIWTYSVL